MDASGNTAAHDYYSTLEVAEQQEGQRQVPPVGREGDKYVTAPGNRQWAHETSIPQVAYENKETSQPITNGEREKKLLGLLPRLFFLVLAGVLLVTIGAVIGGAVGGTVGKKSHRSSPSPSSSSTSPAGTTGASTAVLANSSLASINYTVAGSSVAYQMVFWQHSSGDLMFSVWDSDNATWQVGNITKNLAQTRISTANLPGTALAAVVRGYPWTEKQFYNAPFRILLFYFSPSHQVQQLFSPDPRGASWQVGPLLTAGVEYKSGNISQLAAWWALCASPQCSGDVSVWYEADGRSLQMLNSSRWAGGTTTVVTNMGGGSGIAVAPVAPRYGLDGPAAKMACLYYENSARALQELRWTQDTGSWNNGTLIATDMPPLQPPALAAMAFANATRVAAGPLDAMVVSLFDNGSIAASLWDNSAWSRANDPNMQGKVYTNFTAVSVLPAAELKFFGLTNDGDIQAFAIDRNSPLSWTYNGSVATS